MDGEGVGGSEGRVGDWDAGHPGSEGFLASPRTQSTPVSGPTDVVTSPVPYVAREWPLRNDPEGSTLYMSTTDTWTSSRGSPKGGGPGGLGGMNNDYRS